MQVDRKELLACLTLAKPGLSSKERVEQSTNFIFMKGALITYNEDIMIKVSLPEAFADFHGAVRAEELFSILNKLTKDDLDVSIKDGLLVIKAGRSVSGIAMEAEVKVPYKEIMKEFNKSASVKIPSSLISAMVRASYCAAKGLQILKLSGVHVHKGKISSTDNFRIFQTRVKGIKELPEFVLPANCLKTLSTYEPTSIGLSSGWAFFKNKQDVLFCVRLIDLSDDPYPDVSANLEVEGTELLLPKGILEALDKADIFAKSVALETDRYVEITLKDSKMIVKGDGPFGWYKESIALKNYKGEELSFLAHPEFLRDIVPYVQTAIIGSQVIKFAGEDFVQVFAQSTPRLG